MKRNRFYKNNLVASRNRTTGKWVVKPRHNPKRILEEFSDARIAYNWMYGVTDYLAKKPIKAWGAGLK